MTTTIDLIDLKPGDKFDFDGGSWHGPSIVLSNTRSGGGPTRFDTYGAIRKLTYRNAKIVNPPGLSYMRDLDHVEILTKAESKIARAWDLIGDSGKFRIVGGRAIYEQVDFHCHTRGDNVRLSRLDFTVDGIKPVLRYVDADTLVEVLERD